MKNIKFIIFAIVIYLGFIIATIPARFALGFVPLPTTISMSNINGTIWRGTAALLRFNEVTLEGLTWDISLLKLLSLSITVDLEVGKRNSDIQGQGQLALSSDSMQVNDVTLNTTAQYLTTIMPLPMGLKATGSIALDISHYVHSEPWCEALAGKLVLRQANVASEVGQVPIDNAQVNLSCQQGAVVGSLQPETNSLGIDTKLTLSTHRQLIVDGYVLPPNNAPQDFVNLLNFSLQPDNQGRYRVDFQSQL